MARTKKAKKSTHLRKGKKLEEQKPLKEAGSGKVTFNPFSITRTIDRASPSLFK